MKILFFILLAFLAVIGTAHIVFEIMYCLFKNDNDNSVLLIIPKENNFDVEFFVRSAVAKVRKLGKNSVNEVVVISDKLDEYEKKQLELLKRDYGFVKIMSAEKFKEKAGL